MRKTARLLVLLEFITLVFVLGCSKERSEPARKVPGDEKTSPGGAAAPGLAPGQPTAVPGGVRELSAQTVATDAMDAAHQARAQKLINDGLRFLLAGRDPDGGWSMGGANRPALTAMALKALIQHPDFTAESAEVKQGFDVLLRYRQKDGGIYEPKEGYANYNTSIAVMALVAAQDPRFNEAVRDAVGFLKGQQIVPGSESPDGQKITEDHAYMGGVSYGKHERPDLSNVGMWMEAMKDAGVPADDPAIQRAMVFITRTQNRSESNPLPWAKASGNDQGFVYAPAVKAGGGQSMAGEEGQGLRSYGSMTYVGFKSMLYAGVDRSDPRVQGAYAWIRRYWRLDSNPNMPQAQSRQGLYYYYHVFAKALRAWGEPVIADADGIKHNWRHELIDALGERVSPDGSWVNDADRWQEGSPVLVTAYVVLALQEAMEK